MLANNFMTPHALGLNDVEFESLVKVLGMLERHEIEEDKFNMHVFRFTCGTPACICGWAEYVSKGKAFPIEEIAGRAIPTGISSMSLKLRRLFGTADSDAPNAARNADRDTAAIALRSFLSTGHAEWPADEEEDEDCYDEAPLSL